MKHPMIAAALASLMSAPIAFAQPATDVVGPNAELAVDGKSTVRDFTCKATKMKVDLARDEAPTPTATERLQAVLTGATLNVASTELDCGDKTMNEHMLDALQAKQHPGIVFKVKTVQVRGETEPVKLEGELTLAGKTLPVQVLVNVTPGANGALRLEGRHLLRMTDWGVKPPSLMFGTMKVRDSVVIRFKLSIEKVKVGPTAAL